MANFIPPIPAGGSRLALGTASPAEALYVGFSDGSVRRGSATCAFVMYDANQRCQARAAARLEEPTRDSNVAELEGLLRLLQTALAQGVRRLVALLDSYQVVEALVKQHEGRATRYSTVLVILELLARFDYVEVRNIANRHNKEADALCAAAY